jgi:hypothetical protein
MLRFSSSAIEVRSLHVRANAEGGDSAGLVSTNSTFGSTSSASTSTYVRGSLAAGDSEDAVDVSTS